MAGTPFITGSELARLVQDGVENLHLAAIVQKGDCLFTFALALIQFLPLGNFDFDNFSKFDHLEHFADVVA